MSKDPPDLRALYKEGEREEFFRKLIPQSPDSGAEDFKKGLGADHDQMELIEELVTVAFEKSGLSEYESLEDLEALTVLNKAIMEPVKSLSENLPEVPEWFTTIWCEHIFKALWKRRLDDLAEKKAKIREGKKPRSVRSTGIVADEAFCSHTQASGAYVALKDMTLQIILLNSKRDTDLRRVYFLPITKCLIRGRPVNEFSSYSYAFFIDEFEDLVNLDPSLPLVQLMRGTVGYFNQEELFRSIIRPESFENALKWLYTSRRDGNLLKFVWRNESTAERYNRLQPGISGNNSPVSPGAMTYLVVPVDKINVPRKDSSTFRWGSPPPSPAPTGPLPPIPTGLSARQLAVLNSPERAQEHKYEHSRNLAAAMRAGKDASETIKTGSSISDSIRQLPIKTGSNVLDINKPLPPIPGGTPRFSDKALEVLHAPEYATPQKPAGIKNPQASLTIRPRPNVARGGVGSKVPNASSSKPESKVSNAPLNKPEPVARKPFLKKGGGSSKSLPTNQASEIPRLPTKDIPPPVNQQIKKAWSLGNKSNPTSILIPAKNADTAGAGTSPPNKGDIKRGGTSRVGLHSPSDDGVKREQGRSNTPFPGPSFKSSGAKKTPQVVTPRAGQPQHASRKVEREGGGTLMDSKDYTRRSPVKPKKPSLIGVAFSQAKRRVSLMLSPNSPRTPGRRDFDGDVQEIIDQNPKPGEPLTPPAPEIPRKSTSFTLKRFSTSTKEREVVVEPSWKKKNDHLKVLKPHPTPKMDRFETQDRRYPFLYTEIKRRTYRRGGDEDIDAQADIFEPSDDTSGVQEIEEDVSGDDEDLKNPKDYMMEQFQKMQNIPELDQMHERVDNATATDNGPWEACCELFQIDPTKTSVDERVRIAGLKTPVYQYQAFGVYWQMKNSRTIGGGFVADEMGLGKTLSFLAYIVVERQLAFLWAEVEKSRKERDHKDRTHLQPGEAGPDAVCPGKGAYGPGWIACPCASPVSAGLLAKPGVRLAIVPPSLVPTWVEQWDMHVDVTEKMLQMSLVIAHDGSNVLTVDGKKDNRDGRHTAVVRRVQANRINFTQKARDIHGHFYPDQAQNGQERILVVTTRDHFNKTWATKFEYTTQIMPEDKNGVEDLYKGKSPGVVYGIAMIDECHEDCLKNKGRSAIVANLPKSGRPFIWGYSGTPLTSTPRSIEGILWAIESLWPKRDRTNKTMTGLEQEQESDLWKYCWKTLNNICLEFESAVKQGTENQIIFQDFYLRFKPFLTMLMIRRTTDTAWFGHPLMKLMPHIHQDVIIAHNPEYDPKIDQFRWLIDSEIEDRLLALRKEWKSGNPTTTAKLPVKFSFNSEAKLRYKQRLFATFPYLAVLGATHHPDHLDLTVEELKKYRGVDEKRNPYFKHLKMITEKSPKMMWLYNFISELDKIKDVNGEEQKIVIMSDFNQVAFIIKLWIERHLKGKSGRVGIIYAGQRPRDRKAIIEGFTDAKDAKKQRKQKANYQFLVGTTRIIGAGLQLTRSCNVVLMEPDFEFHRELQGYARVHRIGQKNPESHSYRLIDATDLLEWSIIERQVARGEYPGRPDTVVDSDDDVSKEGFWEPKVTVPQNDAAVRESHEHGQEEIDDETRALLEEFRFSVEEANNVPAPLNLMKFKSQTDSPEESNL